MRFRALLCAAAIVGLSSSVWAASWEEIVNAGNQSRDWLNYGGDLGQMRFAPSDQINSGNVKNLRLKFIHQSGVIGSYETTPIAQNGILYFTTPYNHVFAVDGSSGTELWHYEHKLGTTIFCCGPNNRGVAIAGDTLYMTTLDAMLIALD